jgi:signal transduction histidine kinase
MEEFRMFEELEQLYNDIKNKLNISEIGEKVSDFIINKFDAEMCEIKFLEENNIFSRIHMGLKLNGKICNDQNLMDNLFGIKRSRVDNSLIGYCIQGEERFEWIGNNESFKEWIHKKKKVPVNKKSAERYLENMPSGTLNNFIVLPILIPNDRRISIMYSAKVCFHIFNLCDGSLDEEKIAQCIKNIDRIFNYLSMVMFNAIFYNRARDEIRINKTIEDISKESNNIDGILEKTVLDFAKKSNSPLATVWFPDHDLKLLVLHSFHINTRYSSIPINEEEIRRLIEINSLKVLKAEDSLIGQLFFNSDLLWVKEPDLKQPSFGKYNWKNVKAALKINQFIALPIRDKDSLIAIIGLHPNLSERKFEKIPLSYFRSFTSQVSTPLKYFIAKNFSDNAKKLSEKLTPLIKKREEIFYNELVYKIMEVIGAEACSVFEVRGGDDSERGIYLKATTDKRDKAKKKIGTKIYNIDSNSITGHVAKTGKPIIVYDVERVQELIPEIQSMSKYFMEKTIAPLHTAYLAVPIPGDKLDFGDRNISSLIIRCINKKARRSFTGFFSVDDKDLLKYVGIVLEYFRKVLEVLYERNDLIDLIIHEIENPIVSIRSKIDLINTERQRDKSFDKKILNKKLKDIEEMASLLTGWSGNMVLLNQLMQDKKISPTKEWTSLWPEVIKHVIYWMAPNFHEKNISPQEIVQNIMKKPIFDRRMQVHADKDHLRQVFYNLFSNAIKYRKKSTPFEIDIQLEEREGEIALKVKDWGVGVPDEDKDQIFQMGFRSNYAKKSNIKGKGFGLWLCKMLLESNGLDIKVAHCENPTTFEVSIPLKYWRYKN